MLIKEIHIEKSRTIEVGGVMGRDKYRKIVIGMTAELTQEDYPLNVEGEVKEHKATLSRMVDEAIKEEVSKFKK
jgi:hypothetical protein